MGIFHPHTYRQNVVGSTIKSKGKSDVQQQWTRTSAVTENCHVH